MTKKELVKIIREVVKVEVKKQVNEILINEGKSSLKKQIKPVKKLSKPKPSKRKKVVQYTENSALNKVLNETVGLNDKSPEMDEYPTMGGGAFDSSRASELLGYGDTLAAGGDKEQQRNMIAAQTLREKNLSVDDVPESVLNALTRDYSDLMKHDKMK
tara:strand:- start:631 stop:1104 length:474 start_codon:yes stop_codon:yes gene_type:complete